MLKGQGVLGKGMWLDATLLSVLVNTVYHHNPIISTIFCPHLTVPRSWIASHVSLYAKIGVAASFFLGHSYDAPAPSIKHGLDLAAMQPFEAEKFVEYMAQGNLYVTNPTMLACYNVVN